MADAKLKKYEDKDDMSFQMFLVDTDRCFNELFVRYSKSLGIKVKGTNKIINKIIDDFSYEELFKVINELKMTEMFFTYLDVNKLSSKYFNQFKPKAISRKDLAKVNNQVQLAFNWIVGGHENGISDGYEDEMPSKEELKTEIYAEVISSTFFEGGFSCGPIKEIRFAGKKYLMNRIDELLESDGF